MMLFAYITLHIPYYCWIVCVRILHFSMAWALRTSIFLLINGTFFSLYNLMLI